jgi:hypothetical protein
MAERWTGGEFRGDNAELMGAWISARNVLGPFRSRSEPGAREGETPAEAGPDAVATKAA